MCVAGLGALPSAPWSKGRRVCLEVRGHSEQTGILRGRVTAWNPFLSESGTVREVKKSLGHVRAGA